MPSTKLMDLRNEYAKHALNSYDEFTKIRQREIRRIGWKAFKGQNSYRAKALNKFNPRGKAYERAIKIEHEAVTRNFLRLAAGPDKLVRTIIDLDWMERLKEFNGNS